MRLTPQLRKLATPPNPTLHEPQHLRPPGRLLIRLHLQHVVQPHEPA